MTELQTKTVACSKSHMCEWCGELIEIGRQAVYRAYTFEGDFNSGYQHPECFEAMNETDFVNDEGFYPGDQDRGKRGEE